MLLDDAVRFQARIERDEEHDEICEEEIVEQIADPGEHDQDGQQQARVELRPGRFDHIPFGPQIEQRFPCASKRRASVVKFLLFLVVPGGKLHTAIR